MSLFLRLRFSSTVNIKGWYHDQSEDPNRQRDWDWHRAHGHRRKDQGKSWREGRHPTSATEVSAKESSIWILCLFMVCLLFFFLFFFFLLLLVFDGGGGGGRKFLLLWLTKGLASSFPFLPSSSLPSQAYLCRKANERRKDSERLQHRGRIRASSGKCFFSFCVHVEVAF